MIKKLIAITILALMLISIVAMISADNSLDMTLDEFKKSVEKANRPTGFWSFFRVFQSSFGSSSWKSCDWRCDKSGDCNPCDINEVTSNCYFCPAGYNCNQIDHSKDEYCSTHITEEYSYSKQCSCASEQQECSGGGEEGDKKCSSGDVYKCESGTWEFYEECDYDCDDGSCESCTPKTCSELEKECGIQEDGCGNDLNCGTCASGKTCENGACVDVGDCSSKEDCKSSAEVICDDGSSWYYGYDCVDNKCEIETGQQIPKSCKGNGDDNNLVLQIIIAIGIVAIISGVLFFIKKRK